MLMRQEIHHADHYFLQGADQGDHTAGLEQRGPFAQAGVRGLGALLLQRVQRDHLHAPGHRPQDGRVRRVHQ